MVLDNRNFKKVTVIKLLEGTEISFKNKNNCPKLLEKRLRLLILFCMLNVVVNIDKGQ